MAISRRSEPQISRPGGDSLGKRFGVASADVYQRQGGGKTILTTVLEGPNNSDIVDMYRLYIILYIVIFEWPEKLLGNNCDFRKQGFLMTVAIGADSGPAPDVLAVNTVIGSTPPWPIAGAPGDLGDLCPMGP